MPKPPPNKQPPAHFRRFNESRDLAAQPAGLSGRPASREAAVRQDEGVRQLARAICNRAAPGGRPSECAAQASARGQENVRAPSGARSLSNVATHELTWTRGERCAADRALTSQLVSRLAPPPSIGAGQSACTARSAGARIHCWAIFDGQQAARAAASGRRCANENRLSLSRRRVRYPIKFTCNNSRSFMAATATAPSRTHLSRTAPEGKAGGRASEPDLTGPNWTGRVTAAAGKDQPMCMCALVLV